MMRWTIALLLLAGMAFLLLVSGRQSAARNREDKLVISVTAKLETEPVLSAGDAADDVALWVKPGHPEKSLLFATDKKRGILIYDLQGHLKAFYPKGKTNNIDLRTNFQLGGETVDILVADERHQDVLEVFAIYPEIPAIRSIHQEPIQVGMEVYGLGLYQNPRTGRTFAFVTSKQGVVKQIELLDNGHGQVVGREVRRLKLDGVVEGTVADDALGWVFLAEEDRAIWRFPADPEGGNQGVVVDSISPGSPLSPDIEGLAIYTGPGTSGYLVASCQHIGDFAVYERRPPHRYVLTFRIVAGNGVDGVSGTDGIEITSAPLGPLFPQGLLVAQDNENDANQNFKLVSWSDLIRASRGRLSLAAALN